MRTHSLICNQFNEIDTFVEQHHLADEKNVLVQIYCGKIDNSFITELLEKIEGLLPHAQIIGTTTDGEMINGTILTDTVVISCTVFSSTRLTSTILTLDDYSSSFELGATLMKKIVQNDTVAVIMFANGLDMAVEDFVDGVNTYKTNAKITGAFAGDNGAFQKSYVFSNKQIVSNGVVAVALSNENLHVHTVSNYDWKETGTTFKITKAKENRIYEMNNKRPISIMSHYLGADFTKQLPTSGPQFPFVINRDGKDIYVYITHVYRDGSVLVSRRVIEGEEVSFSYANVPSIIDKSISEIKKLAKKPVETIIAFNCMARRRYFRSYAEQELKLLEQISPITGCFSYGEFITTKGKCELVSNTLSFLALSENEQVPLDRNIDYNISQSDEIKALMALSNLIHASSKDREDLYKNLEVSQQRYQSLFEHNTEVVYSTDLEGRFTSVNPAFEKALGYTEEEVLNKSSLIYIKEKDIPKARMHFQRTLKGKEQYYELELISKSGESLLFLIKNIPIIINGEKVGVYGIGRNITDQRRAEEKIAYLAYFDPDTGLPNRLRFTEQMEEFVQRMSKKKKKLAIMFIDLDRFKLINDTVGHYAGDTILKELVNRMKGLLPPRTYLARFSGDKFTILFTKYVEIVNVVDFGQKILHEISKPIMYEGQEFFLTGSLGVSIYPNDGVKTDLLLKHADTAMNLAKQQGGNKMQFYSTEMNEQVLYQLELESYLRRALEKDEFHLCYQPLVDLATGEIYGSEALIRWQHPKLGLVSPGEFIPLAEETGLIHDIGKWVLKRACQENKKWQDMGYGHLTISVNVSANQFQQISFIDEVKEALNETGLAPQYLTLELTEGVMLRNISHSIIVMKELQKLGVKVSIDDFGTGYSSLSYLKDLPINTLKIDRTFINNLKVNTSDIAIVKAIITMGHGLSVKVVAEGVETNEQIALLKELECHYAQGYYINKPLKSDDFEKGLRQLKI
ncbi:EAL domain-containing protein [Fredinandcohnia humi]